MDARPNISLIMLRDTLDNIPQYAPPEGYYLRPYQAGDEQHWLDIHRESDNLNDFPPDIFVQQFGDNEVTLAERQVYLCDAEGVPVGTATAWFNDDFRGLRYGRIHWVALRPSVQGRGLSKPLLTAVCNRLKAFGYERAYLTTGSLRLPAIGLYLKFGFVPDNASPEAKAVWDGVLRQIEGR